MNALFLMDYARNWSGCALEMGGHELICSLSVGFDR